MVLGIWSSPVSFDYQRWGVYKIYIAALPSEWLLAGVLQNLKEAIKPKSENKPKESISHNDNVLLREKETDAGQLVLLLN